MDPNTPTWDEEVSDIAYVLSDEDRAFISDAVSIVQNSSLTISTINRLATLSMQSLDARELIADDQILAFLKDTISSSKPALVLKMACISCLRYLCGAARFKLEGKNVRFVALRSHLLDLGFIEAVAPYLHMVENWNVIAAAADCLRRIGREDKSTPLLFNAKIAEPLVRLLKDDVPDVCCLNACGALMNLCQTRPIEEYVAGIGAVPLLFDVLKHRPIQLKAHAANVIKNLGGDPPNNSLIHAAGGLELFMVTMDSDHEELACNSTTALGRLAMEASYSRSMVAAGLMMKLLHIAQTGTPERRSSAIDLVFIMICHETNDRDADVSRDVLLSLKTMLDTTDQEEDLITTMNCFRNISIGTTRSITLCRIGLPHSLIRIFELGKENLSLEAARIIQNIAIPDITRMTVLLPPIFHHLILLLSSSSQEMTDQVIASLKNLAWTADLLGNKVAALNQALTSTLFESIDVSTGLGTPLITQIKLVDECLNHRTGTKLCGNEAIAWDIVRSRGLVQPRLQEKLQLLVRSACEDFGYFEMVHRGESFRVLNTVQSSSTTPAQLLELLKALRLILHVYQPNVYEIIPLHAKQIVQSVKVHKNAELKSLIDELMVLL